MNHNINHHQLERFTLKQLREKLIRAPRERLWDQIRKSPKDFTLVSVAAIAKMNVDSARDYLKGLERAGYIKETHREVKPVTVGGNTKVVHYELINDTGHEAPAVNRLGQDTKPREVNKAIWNTLRICGAVTPRVLAAQASTETCKVSPETANSYLQMLRRAGYVVIVSESSHKRQAHYRLLPDRNTGPKPPQILRASKVLDSNTGEVVWEEYPEFNEELRDGDLSADPVLEDANHE